MGLIHPFSHCAWSRICQVEAAKPLGWLKMLTSGAPTDYRVLDVVAVRVMNGFSFYIFQLLDVSTIVEKFQPKDTM